MALERGSNEAVGVLGRATTQGLPAIERLIGRANWRTWKFAVRTYLEVEDLWEAIEPIPKEDGTPTEVNPRTDRIAKGKIILLLDPVNYVHVEQVTTATEVWKKLCSTFEDNGLTRQWSLLHRLITTNLVECGSMDAYVNRMITTAHQLIGIGFPLSEKWIGMLLLAGLPEEYRPMVMGLENSGLEITGDLIKTKLFQEMEVTLEVKNRVMVDAIRARVELQDKVTKLQQDTENVTQHLADAELKASAAINRASNLESQRDEEVSPASTVIVSGKRTSVDVLDAFQHSNEEVKLSDTFEDAKSEVSSSDDEVMQNEASNEASGVDIQPLQGTTTSPVRAERNPPKRLLDYILGVSATAVEPNTMEKALESTESSAWKARWKSSNDTVQKMLDGQIDREKQFTKTERQLAQKLCRTLPLAVAKGAENSDGIAAGKEVGSDHSQQCKEEGTTGMGEQIY